MYGSIISTMVLTIVFSYGPSSCDLYICLPMADSTLVICGYLKCFVFYNLYKILDVILFLLFASTCISSTDD